MSKKGTTVPKRLKKAAEKSESAPSVPRAKKPVIAAIESTIEETQQAALERVANEVFKGKIPPNVTELLSQLILDDTQVIWELLSFVDDSGSVIDPENFDLFIEELRQEREKYYPNPNERLPREKSPVFLSPALTEERKADLQKDILLLRKPLYVKGPIKCIKCSDNYIATIQFTLRSFDEPSINIFICGTCYYSWSSQ